MFMYNSSSQQKAEFRKKVSLFRIKKKHYFKNPADAFKRRINFISIDNYITPFQLKATRPDLPTNWAVFIYLGESLSCLYKPL